MKLTNEQINRIFKAVELSDHYQILLINNFGVAGIDNDEYNNNLYCLDANKVIVWQVKSPKNMSESDAFSYVKILEDEIFAKKESGAKFRVDKKTGVAVEIGFDK